MPAFKQNLSFVTTASYFDGRPAFQGGTLNGAAATVTVYADTPSGLPTLTLLNNNPTLVIYAQIPTTVSNGASFFNLFPTITFLAGGSTGDPTSDISITTGTSSTLDAAVTLTSSPIVSNTPGPTVTVSGLLQGVTPSTGLAESWHVMSPLQNSWTDGGSSGGQDHPSYIYRPWGAVELKGLALAGTKTNGTIIFTLPSGYIPPFVRTATVQGDTNISPFVANIQIDTSGNIKVFDLGSGDAVSFDGILFSLT